MAKLVKLYRSDGSSFNEEYYVATDWSIINNKPTNFTPAEHYHDISSIGNGSYSRAGTLTPIKQSLFDFARGNRFSFINPSVVTLECTDNGVDWTNYGATDEQIIRFFSGINTPIYIGKNTSSLTGYTANSKTRITIDAEGSGTYFGDWYTTLIWACTNGSVGLNVTIEASTVANPNKFTTIVSSVPLSGWSGPNEIGHPGLIFGTSFPELYRKVRFIFGIDSIGGDRRAEIWQLRAYSYSIWAGTSNMAYNDHLYSWDAYQNAYFPNKVYTANGVLEAVTKNSSNNSLDEPLNLKYGQYAEPNYACGMNANNSDIIGLNGLYFSDECDGPGEGINFYNSVNVWDTLYAAGGNLYFHGSRAKNQALNGNLILAADVKGTYDCNNLITPGFYTITGNVGITHAPVTDSFSIIVSRTDIPANGTYIHQLAMQDSTHNVYVRYYNGSTWSSWRKLLYDDEKAYDTTRVDGKEVKYYTQSQFASITPVAGVHYVIYEN